MEEQTTEIRIVCSGKMKAKMVNDQSHYQYAWGTYQV